MIIDLRTFGLRSGTDEAAFLALDARVQTEVVVHAHGFIRRTTARSGDGRWLVETLWFDHDLAAAAGAADDEVSAGFWAMVDPGTLEVAQFETLE